MGVRKCGVFRDVMLQGKGPKGRGASGGVYEE